MQTQHAGELFGVSYDFELAPHAYYTVIDAGGAVKLDMPISLPQPLMMHDSAVTEEYVIFVATPLVYAPEVRSRIVRCTHYVLSFHLQIIQMLGLNVLFLAECGQVISQEVVFSRNNATMASDIRQHALCAAPGQELRILALLLRQAPAGALWHHAPLLRRRVRACTHIGCIHYDEPEFSPSCSEFATQSLVSLTVHTLHSIRRSAITWFELPPMMVMHTAAAWQEGSTVKLAACCFDEVPWLNSYSF